MFLCLLVICLKRVIIGLQVIVLLEGQRKGTILLHIFSCSDLFHTKLGFSKLVRTSFIYDYLTYSTIYIL